MYWLAYTMKVTLRLGYLLAILVKSDGAKGFYFVTRAFIVGAKRGIPARKGTME